LAEGETRTLQEGSLGLDATFAFFVVVVFFFHMSNGGYSFVSAAAS
jgi:hypothetical protein